jgi:hypothetical protein
MAKITGTLYENQNTFMKKSRSFLLRMKNISLRVVKVGRAIPLQALTGPEGSRILRLPDFKTVGTWWWQGCQPYAPLPQEIFLVLISVRG